MPNTFPQDLTAEWSRLEEKLLELVICMAKEVRRGVPHEEIQSIMLQRGHDSDKEITLAKLFYDTCCNIKNFDREVVFNGLKSKGFTDRFSECLLDEIQIRTSRDFLLNMYIKIFSDMHHSIEPEGPEYFRKKPFIFGTSNNQYDTANRVIWINDKQDKLLYVWDLLVDYQSKYVFEELLRYSASGPKHVRVSKDSHYYWELYQTMMREVKIETVMEKNNPEFIYGGTRVFQFLCQERILHIFCSHGCLYPTFYLDQYFVDRATVRIKPEIGDFVVDGGGFVGETAVRFSVAVGTAGKVYCFEPVYEHIQIIKQNIIANKLDNIVIMPYGLFDVNQENQPIMIGTHLMPTGSNAAISIHNNPDITKFPLAVLDDLVHNGTIERVDFIKMDIEGAEMEALRGAEDTIRKFKPKLAICVYHKLDHIYQIPEWIDGLGIGYKFYMDYFHHAAVEQVIFATTDPLPPL